MTSRLETLRQKADETIEPVKEALDTLTRYQFNEDSYSSAYFKDYIEYATDIVMAAQESREAYEAHRPLRGK